jgi:hypothetical protein
MAALFAMEGTFVKRRAAVGGRARRLGGRAARPRNEGVNIMADQMRKTCSNCEQYMTRKEAIKLGKKVGRYFGWCKYHDRLTQANGYWCEARRG